MEKTRLRRMRSEKDFVEKQKGYLTKDKGYQVTINWLPERNVGAHPLFRMHFMTERKNNMLPVRHGLFSSGKVILRIHNWCTRRIPETSDTYLIVVKTL